MRVTATTTFLGLAVAAALPAAAQSPPPAPPVPQAAPDETAIWSIQDENASITTSKLPDRYYTNGIRLGWTSGEGSAPELLADVGQSLWGEGRQRIALDVTQQIYNPSDTLTTYPPLTDRPYAGVLLGTVSLIHDGDGARSVLGLGLGLVGPSALGEQVQNGFHRMIGEHETKGWDTQLHDEPLIQITGERTWRLPIGAVGAMDTDALPEVTAAIGNLRIYAQTGVTLRLGQGLDSDYGVPRLRPGLNGTDVFRPTLPFAWYLFAGIDGQAVAYDVTLNGNLWQDSRNVSATPLVGEGQVGFALMAFGVRLAYTHVFQTQEFKHQTGGLHQFGSLALSVRF